MVRLSRLRNVPGPSFTLRVIYRFGNSASKRRAWEGQLLLLILWSTGLRGFLCHGADSLRCCAQLGAALPRPPLHAPRWAGCCTAGCGFLRPSRGPGTCTRHVLARPWLLRPQRQQLYLPASYWLAQGAWPRPPVTWPCVGATREERRDGRARGGSPAASERTVPHSFLSPDGTRARHRPGQLPPRHLVRSLGCARAEAPAGGLCV